MSRHSYQSHRPCLRRAQTPPLLLTKCYQCILTLNVFSFLHYNLCQVCYFAWVSPSVLDTDRALHMLLNTQISKNLILIRFHTINNSWRLKVCIFMFHEISFMKSSSRLHLFDQKYCKIVKYYYNLKHPFSIFIIFENIIYSCDQSWIFSIITPVFSVTWSSEIILIYWFAAQETFLLLSMLKAVVPLHISVDWKFKRTAFIWNSNVL